MEPFFVDYLNCLRKLQEDFVVTFEDMPQEALDWVPGADMNSLCVLVVHTTGSARFWIGDVALSENSNRDRPAEFMANGLTIAELKDRFATLDAYVSGALERLTLADLSVQHTVPMRSEQISGGWAIMHALEHTGLHLGHAQMTRQLWQQKQGG